MRTTVAEFRRHLIALAEHMGTLSEEAEQRDPAYDETKDPLVEVEENAYILDKVLANIDQAIVIPGPTT